ncbi:hypothetical protein LTR53_006191 [Teratosphaeriaceae sp. CCFEE 6253]|nr:hypothetical protein LTR53_006191 [Teratosphaeriaceae sp. CCFEE 6253]
MRPRGDEDGLGAPVKKQRTIGLRDTEQKPAVEAGQGDLPRLWMGWETGTDPRWVEGLWEMAQRYRRQWDLSAGYHELRELAVMFLDTTLKHQLDGGVKALEGAVGSFQQMLRTRVGKLDAYISHVGASKRPGDDTRLDTTYQLQKEEVQAIDQCARDIALLESLQQWVESQGSDISSAICLQRQLYSRSKGISLLHVDGLCETAAIRPSLGPAKFLGTLDDPHRHVTSSEKL